MTKYSLYSYFRSSCAYRVRIVLALKGIPYQYETIDLMKDGGEQMSENYLSVNPLGQVPALVVDDGSTPKFTIAESAAIIDYLETIHPTPALLPKDTYLRAKTIEISQAIVSGIQPLQNITILGKIESLGGDKEVWAQEVIKKKFIAIEKILEKTAGKCCVGDEVTLADVCLVPQVFNARRFKIDIGQYKFISKICTHLEKLPAFEAAHPSKQPDAR